MAPKSAKAEFQRMMLNRPHRENNNNSPGSAGSEDPKFTVALWSSTPEAQPQKKQKGKNVAIKEKEVVEVDTDVSLTSVGKYELNILTEDFLYQKFKDRILMTLATLKQFRGDEDDLVEKALMGCRVLLKLVIVCRYSKSVISSRVWAR